MGDEPVERNVNTDFLLCLYCQNESQENVVNPNHQAFKHSSYENFLKFVNQKYQLGNPDFISVWHRVKGFSAEYLREKSATWHKSCYRDVVSHIERDKERQKRAVTQDDVGIVTNRKRGRPSKVSNDYEHNDPNIESTVRLTRSQTITFDKTKCIFCYAFPEAVDKYEEDLYNCRTSNKGNEIQDIVRKSGNEEWKIRLADVLATGDLHSRDIMYHHSCRTTYWEKFIQRPSRKSLSKKKSIEPEDKENTLGLIAGEMQFFSELQKQLDEGIFIDLNTAMSDYHKVLSEFGLDKVKVSKYLFKQKIEKNLKHTVITPSYNRKPPQIHLSSIGKELIINEAEQQSMHADTMKTIYQSAEQLRNVIKKI